VSTLTGKTIGSSYKDLLQISNNNIGVDTSVRYIEDGEGTPSVLGLSTHVVEVAGDIIPDIAGARDIGTSTKPFRDIYLTGNTIHLGDQQLSSGDILTIRDVQNGVYATAAQGQLADTSLQPGDNISYQHLTNTPATLAGYGITDAATQSYVHEAISIHAGMVEWVTILNTPTTLAGYGITDAASKTQGELASTALQPGDLISHEVLIETPTTLAGYGITDALSQSDLDNFQGFDGVFSSLTNTPTTLAGYGITDAATESYVDSAITSSQGTSGWINITNTPTTLAGYGITDAASKTQGDLASTALQPGDGVSFEDVTNTPVTLAGYGITDAVTQSDLTGFENNLEMFDGNFNNLTNTPVTLAGYGITDAFSGEFADLTGIPTTLAGYGITDALSQSDLDNFQGFDGVFSSLTNTPTTLAGYGITDAFSGNFNNLSNTPTTLAGYGITDVIFDGSFNNLTNTPTTLGGYGILDGVVENTNVSFSMITTNTIRGGNVIVIDPAGIGDNTGVVRVMGDLLIDGTTTSINSTTLNVEGKTLTLAEGSTSGTAANGSGIIIDGGDARLIYESGTDVWSLNKSLQLGTNYIRWSQGDGFSIGGNSTWAVGTTDVFSVTLSGIVPDSNMTFDLGNQSKHWDTIYSHDYWIHNSLNFSGGQNIDNEDVIKWNTTSSAVQVDQSSELGLYTGNGLALKAVHIDGDGQVGIGTTSPNAKLEVDGQIVSNSRFMSENSLELVSDYNDNGATSIISFKIDGQGVDNEKMRIAADGKVGIGTTTPSVALDIESALQPLRGYRQTQTSTTDLFTLNSDVGNTNALVFKIEAGGSLTTSGTVNSQSRSGWTGHNIGSVNFDGDTIVITNVDQGYNLLEYGDDLFFDNFRMTVEFSTTNETHWGLSFGAENGSTNPEDNMWSVILRDTNIVRIQQRLDGVQSYHSSGVNGYPVDLADVDLDDGDFHTLMVERIGSRLYVCIDGYRCITETNFPVGEGLGVVGLTTFEDLSTVTFRNFKIDRLSDNIQTLNGPLEVVGETGQLFSVMDDPSGVLFGVNDSSGIPSLEVNESGDVSLIEFGGKLNIGNPTYTGALVNVGGTIDATAHTTNSDINLKFDIKQIENALNKVNSLRGYTFKYKSDGHASTGLIAQEVESVLPEVVFGTHGSKSISYGNVIGLLVESINELSESHREEIRLLTSKFEYLEGVLSSMQSQINNLS
jgi:hypothetical protein